MCCLSKGKCQRECERWSTREGGMSRGQEEGGSVARRRRRYSEKEHRRESGRERKKHQVNGGV